MIRKPIIIPGYIHTVPDNAKDDLLKLFRIFNSTRRRLYNMKWKKGLGRDICIHNLQIQGTPLNTRYLKDAWFTIEHLPPHVTFGGIKNQKLREKGKITREQWEECRNSILVSRGDKSKKGNLNIRIIDDNGNLKLRVNIPFRNPKYIYLGLFIPEKYRKKYGKYLTGNNPYTVILKREKGKIYAKISTVISYNNKESKRIMAIDINAGHIDFTVVDKENKRILSIGRVNTDNKDIYVVAEKIQNIANHYDADIVVGKLNSHKFKAKNCHKANRKINHIPHSKLRIALKKKCAEKGRVVIKKSEAYTSKIGAKISQKTGIDIHKASAIAFALKVINYDDFRTLKESHIDEGDGSLNMGRIQGCGITSPIQSNIGLDGNDGFMPRGYAQIPGMGGLSILERIKADLRCVQCIKIP